MLESFRIDVASEQTPTTTVSLGSLQSIKILEISVRVVEHYADPRWI